MNFIVDECTGTAVAQHLRAAGHDVVVASESMGQADDPTILNRAVDEKRILITNDKDFGELVFRQGFLHHGVLRILCAIEHKMRQFLKSGSVRGVPGNWHSYRDPLFTIMTAPDSEADHARRTFNC